VKSVVDYVCTKKGGEGAVREMIELILDAQASKSKVRVKGR